MRLGFTIFHAKDKEQISGNSSSFVYLLHEDHCFKDNSNILFSGKRYQDKLICLLG